MNFKKNTNVFKKIQNFKNRSSLIFFIEKQRSWPKPVFQPSILQQRLTLNFLILFNATHFHKVFNNTILYTSKN
jgi:hypothetical protein